MSRVKQPIEFKQNERVSLTIEDDGVAQLRLIRKDKLNALDADMFDALIAAGKALFDNRGVRAVVIAGEGRAFSAGIDLGNFNKWSDGAAPDFTARTHGNANRFQHVALQWRKLPVPVIAAVHGVCFGGGLQIASGADIRVVSPNARLSIMEMKWGLVPDMGGYALWKGMVRDDVLRDLIYTNREVSGEEALQLGLATHVDADPLSLATQIARVIAQRNPHAIRAAKALCNRSGEARMDEILLAESHEQHKLKGSRNQVEAVASQMEGRAPDFTDP